MNDSNHASMSSLEQATESTLAKVIARFAVPALLAIISFFIVQTLNHIQAQQEHQTATQATQGADISQIKSDVRDVNTRLDGEVIRQVSTNTTGLQKLDDRVQKIERKAHIP